MYCNSYDQNGLLKFNLKIAALYFSFGCVSFVFFSTHSVLLISGFGGSLIFTPAYVIVGQYFSKRKGKAMGVSTLGSGLGTVIVAPLISLLLEHYGYQGAMMITGALILNKKVLLRERKRHTARRVVSTPCCPTRIPPPPPLTRTPPPPGGGGGYLPG